ncbi:hypothetical protein BCR42DRAFT_454060 [Absidia repens]|uniref:Uncharacterized protein n=1 Tax=Absidia repens TaxID=90262 RepID=A0A1X2I8L0_9FUNG|nr:hypothetical protein BCR42DRAFT_454060 [Absidia repens]
MLDELESSPPFAYCKQLYTYGNHGSPLEDLNLTAFEVKVANQLCSIRWANHNVRYELDQHHNEVEGIAIASLVQQDRYSKDYISTALGQKTH